MCVSLVYSLIQAKKQNKSADVHNETAASTVQPSDMCCETSRRDCMAKCQNGNQIKGLQKFFYRAFSKMQAFHRHRSTDGHHW